jgi:hypothetical protein
LDSNPILALGEAGYEMDSRYMKVGDGTTAWSGLNYITVPQSSIYHPDVYLGIRDGIDQRLSINLSNGDGLNILGSGDTSILYDDVTRTITVSSVGTSGFLTSGNIVSKLGYTPQPLGNYSYVGHLHNINDISGLSAILDSSSGYITSATISEILGYPPQPSGNYSSIGHTHLINNISGLSTILNGLQLGLDTKQNSGSYASAVHSHTLYVGDGSVSRVAYNSNNPLHIIGQGIIEINYDDYTNQIAINAPSGTGILSFNNRVGNVQLNFTDISGALGYVAQPVGSYSLSEHKHFVSDVSGITVNRTPTNINDSGNPGDMCYDSDYFYICISEDNWRRIPHSSW